MSRHPPTLVTIATYNEMENLQRLVAEVLRTDPALNVLVIDDNSPDGTGEIADRLAAEDARVHVMHRPGKLGLGTAVVAGMRYAVEHGYAYMLNMDADFSHHPRYIPAILAGMASNDVMIGSRYIPGGGVVGWNAKRRFMSTSINLYARLLLRLRAHDASGAFRCYRVSKLRELRFDRILSKGYSFMEEILYRCRLIGCRMGETPITFEDRRLGRSKINRAEATRALVVILRLAKESLFGMPA